MPRTRTRAAARKRQNALEHEIASGVYSVAREIAPLVKPGALYWQAPLQYVAEQMAPRVCAEHKLPADRREDVAGYLLSAMNEFMVALAGEFDQDHFDRWIAAQDASG